MKSAIIKKKVMWGVLMLWVPLALAPQLITANDKFPNQLIVRIADGRTPNDIPALANMNIASSIANRNFLLISLPQNSGIERAIERLGNQPGIIFAQPNYKIAFPEADQVSQVVPDEKEPQLDMGTSPPDYFGQSEMYVNSDLANLISTGEGVIVAVIDNGIAYAHPLFDGVLGGSGYDFLDDDADASEELGTVMGHGTFVSGIILRIAPDCQLIPLRAFNGNGIGSSFAVAQSIYWAIDNQVDVINMSFSMFVNDSVISEAVAAAAQAGIVMSASTGNDNVNISAYPAALSSVIAISAIDSLDYRASFSNYGNYVDMCAPGVSVYSSLAGDYEWGRWSGTSFSAPMAAAVAALIISLDQSLNSDGVSNLIKSTAITELQWGTILPQDPEYGSGRLDALEAVVSMVRGDVDGSGVINILDINYLTSHVHHGGPAPIPLPQVGDMDRSGNLDQTDIDMLIDYIDM